MNNVTGTQLFSGEGRNRLSLGDQQAKIKESPGYSELFHDTFLNNYSVICLNKRYDKDALIEDKKNSLRKLNVACYNLQAFSNICLEKIRTSGEFCQEDDTVLKYGGIENELSKTIKAGNSFLTYEMAEELINGIRNMNFPFDDMLGTSKYKVILDAFINLHYYNKAFVKICMYIKYEEVYDVLKEIIRKLQEVPLLFYYIERIELAKEEFSTSRAELLKEEEYPSLSIFFDSRIISTHYHPIVVETLDLLVPITRLVSELEFNAEYSFIAEKNTVICQGFRNYKKYLNLLHILDSVYDKESNYAFIHNR